MVVNREVVSAFGWIASAVCLTSVLLYFVEKLIFIIMFN